MKMIRGVMTTMILFSCGVLFGQVKSEKNEPVKTVSKPVFPSKTGIQFYELKQEKKDVAEGITGEFKIDRVEVTLKQKASKALTDSGVGSVITISEDMISGALIDSMAFVILDQEYLESTDFLFRTLGQMPEKIPADLPTQIFVRKVTPNFKNSYTIYGIGKLTDGTIILPYYGTLLYLTKL